MTTPADGENSERLDKPRRLSSRQALYGGLAVVALVGVFIAVRRGGSDSGKVGTDAATNVSPQASPAPSVTPIVPTAKTERRAVGSASLLIPAGLLVRENAALKSLFANAGVDLIATQSIGNTTNEAINAKIASAEMTPEEALQEYWRLDVLELGNPGKITLAEWLKTYWPKYPDDNMTVTKSQRKINRKPMTVHTLTAADNNLVQTIYFAQPAAGGSVVILSSFEGTEHRHQKEILALVDSVEFP